MQSPLSHQNLITCVPHTNLTGAGLRTYTARLSYLRIPDDELTPMLAITPPAPPLLDSMSHSFSMGESINLETEASEVAFQQSLS